MPRAGRCNKERMMAMKENKDFEARNTEVIEDTSVDAGATDGSEGEKRPLGGTVRLLGREFPKKGVVVAGIGGLLVLALVGGGALYAATASRTDGGEPAREAVADTGTGAEEQHVLSIGASADGWDAETSSPVIAHVVNEDEGVDYYHAYDANVEVALGVPAGGGYEVSFIAPVNADGSTYRAPDASTVQAVVADDADSPARDADLPFVFEQVAAEDMGADDITGIAAQVAEAVRKGDETLTGERGAKVVELVERNLKANGNADEDAITEQSEAASEVVGSDSSQASTGGSSNTGTSSDTGGSSTGGGSTGNSGSSSGGQTAHSHDWVAQTKTVHHDAQYKTVHHDAEYTTIHHDAQYKNVCVCNGCGAQFDNHNSWGTHSESQALSGNYSCGSYHTTNVVTQQAYDEQVLVKDAYDEQVLVNAAYDETVTTGYKCSGCGATK